MSVYITSDLHGELRNFKSILKMINFHKEKDVLFILGDVLDRGTKSIELLSYIRKYSDSDNPAIRLIKGNHELFAQMYIEGKVSKDSWIKWGGKQTADQIDSMTNEERLDLLNYLKNLQHYVVIEQENGKDWVLSHSGIHLDFLKEDESGIDVVQSIEDAVASFGKSINIFCCSGCGRKMNVCRGAILKCRINVAVTESKKCVETTISVKRAEQAIFEDIKLKCRTFIDMRAEIKRTAGDNVKTLEEKIASIEKTMEYIEFAWKNIYSDYADRKISKDEYLLQSKEHKQKKQALAEELEKLKIEKKKKESDTSSDMVEMLLKKFSEAEELTNEIKSVMIEKVLVYGNNALEIYWKPDFAKYFESTELRVGKEKVHNE